MIARPVACAQLLDAEGFVARRPTSRSERLSLGRRMSNASLPFSSSRESTGSAILCGFATRRADGAGHLDVEMAIVGSSEPADHP